MKRPTSYYWSITGTHNIGFGAYNSVTPVIAHTATTVGSDVSDYKLKIAKLQDASSNYSTSFYDEEGYKALTCASEHKATQVTSHATSWLKHGNIFVPVTSIPLNAGLQDLALKRIKSKLATTQDNFKILIPLGELKETRQLIKSSAEITTNLLKDVLKFKRSFRNTRYRKEVIKHLSEAWLQYSFAIKPTISDTEQALSSISSHLLKRDYTARVSAGSGLDWVDNVGVDYNTYSACAGHNWLASKLYRAHSLRYKYTCGVSFDMQNANDYTFNKHFGLELGDIIPAAYELFPFSWLIDYFSTMGDFLEDTFTSSAGNTIYCTESVLYKVVRNRNFSLVNAQPNYFSTLASDKGTVTDTTTRYQRTKLGVLPHRSFRVKSIDEIGKNSVNKLLNLASLAVLLHKP